MALVCKWLIFQGSSIKVYPQFDICRIFLCNNLQILFSKKSFKISFIVHLKKTLSTQLIFCFDLPNFVLTGRFHAVEKRPTQQLK